MNSDYYIDCLQNDTTKKHDVYMQNYQKRSRKTRKGVDRVLARSRSRQKYEGLGRSRLGMKIKRLGIVLVSGDKVSYTSLD